MKKFAILGGVFLLVFALSFVSATSYSVGDVMVSESWASDGEFDTWAGSSASHEYINLELGSGIINASVIPKTTLTAQTITVYAYDYVSLQYDLMQTYTQSDYSPFDKDYYKVFSENISVLLGQDSTVNGFTGFFACASWMQENNCADIGGTCSSYDYADCIYEGESFDGAMESYEFPNRAIIDGEEYFNDGIMKLDIRASGSAMAYHPNPLYFNLTLTEAYQSPNSAPTITNEQSNFDLQIAEDYSYNYDATDGDNDSLTWYDNTALFDINPSTGAISLTGTTSEDVGSYPITISVSDGTVNTTDSFTITIPDAQGGGLSQKVIRTLNLRPEEDSAIAQSTTKVGNFFTRAFSGISNFFGNIIDFFKNLF